jgi:hypothetical protein
MTTESIRLAAQRGEFLTAALVVLSLVLALVI